MRDEAYRLRGLRFYRFDEGSQTPTVVQLLRYDDSHQRYRMRDVFDGNTIYIDRATLEEKWVKLNPDGLLEFLSCTAVDNQGQEVPDVAVMLHRKDEYGHMLVRPYAVCRQAVLDIFILLQQSRYVVVRSKTGRGGSCRKAGPYMDVCLNWHRPLLCSDVSLLYK